MTIQVAPGTLIDDRYRVISRVGSGGMADVYCAEDVQLGRRIAVKLLHTRFAADEEFVERFRREASSAASLSHANIVSVYDRGEWSGTYYIAMEYLDGRSLDSIVREEAPLPSERAIEITEQVLRAARFAHRHGVVHRDLKPHNVILDEEGRVKVTDFGIARAGASEITQTGSIMGTARYLSPEQAQGNPVSPRSDLYAIGVMLYELLTGTVPFEGDSVVAIALRHLSEPPRPPSSLAPAVSPMLDSIVLRALAKSPEQRFGDADEFLAALEGERARLRGDGGSQTAALAPVVLPPAPVYRDPATQTTQALGPLSGVHTGVGVAWWDPNTTGSVSIPVPAAELAPVRGRDRGPVWPWVLISMIAVAAAAVALVVLLDRSHHNTPVTPAVPNVVGQTEIVALSHIEQAGYYPNPRLVPSSHSASTVIAQRPIGGVRLTKGSTVVLEISKGPGALTAQVPNVIGASAGTAQRALHAAGFNPSTARESSTTIAKNKVISAAPAVGTSAKHGSTVVLTVSSGPPPVAVPDVVGETYAQARLVLQQRLFVVKQAPRATVAKAPGTVLAQSPASGNAPQGSTVTVTVAVAPPNVAVPLVLGDTPAAAGAALSKAGLTPLQVTVVKEVNPNYNGLVISQQPRAGSSLPPGTTVVIRVEQYQAPTVPTSPTGTSGGPTGPSGATSATGVT